MRRRALLATVTTLVVLAAGVIGWRLLRPEPIVLAQAVERPIAARLSDARADRFRPYGGARMTREEVRVDTLAQLQRRGDWRGLADAELLAGDPARAAEALARAAKAPARAGASADVESDRAALALVEHDAAAALGHAARALGLAPGHRQAAWNRALALAGLGLAHEAIGAFQALAARGEKGWSDEAKARADELRAAIGQASARARQPAPAAATAGYDEARALLHQGDAPAASARALAALALAQKANADPSDLPRRLYVLLAEAARAQGQGALADAYVDEARALMP